MTTDFYDAIVEVAEAYLGPPARRFMARQINFHLGKGPEDLSPDDIPKLTEWVKKAMALLTEDSLLLDQFEAQMNEVTKLYAKA